MTSHGQYCTLYRLGYWCSLDAECRADADAEFPSLIDHDVAFVLINKYGDRSQIGSALITAQTGRGVFDANGDTFPDLETAVRSHAAKLMKVTEMPGRWTNRPARHETWQGTVATAFEDARG